MIKIICLINNKWVKCHSNFMLLFRYEYENNGKIKYNSFKKFGSRKYESKA